MAIKLRPYQAEAVNAIFEEWNMGHKRTLLALPTGTGKTCVFASVIDRNYRQTHGKALVLAHRTELLQQAADKIRNVCGFDCALEKADFHANESRLPVVVGSVQTLSNNKRLEQYPANYFDMIVVDEAHHTISDSYQQVLQYFSSAKVLGVTATYDRGDKRSLGTYYQSIAYEYELKQAIKDGYLCPVISKQIPLKIDISHVKISEGDYAVNDLGKVLEEYLNLIADALIENAKDRKIVVFLPLIKTSTQFTAILNQKGIKAAEVNGESADRDEILEDFANGKYQVLCNSMLLTEGWDCPSVDCIVVLRPTKIRSLYVQMVGRGTRLSPETGKKDLLIPDFLWLTGKHDLCKPSCIFATTDEIKKEIDKIADDGEKHDLSEATSHAEASLIKALEAAQLKAQKRELAKAESKRKREEAKQIKAEKAADKNHLHHSQFAESIQDEELLNYIPVSDWDNLPVSDDMLRELTKFDISQFGIKTIGYASLLLKKLRERKNSIMTTPKQILKLEKRGFRHVGTWTKNDATEAFDILSSGRDGLCPYGFRAKEWIPPSKGTSV